MALDYNIIGERIKRARISKGLTQEQLAEKLDVSIAFLSRIERGSSHINLRRLDEICNILGISQGFILEGTSEDSRKLSKQRIFWFIKKLSTRKIKTYL